MEHLTIRDLIRNALVKLGVIDEIPLDELIKNFIYQQEHKTLLERIEAIRTNSNYIPDYNRPKLYTDVSITYLDNGVEKPISMNTRLACERPIDFNNDIKAWKKITRLEHKKEINQKKKDEETKTELDKTIKKDFGSYIMKKMSEVY